jgi:CRP-like cAMP-binding protein
MYSQSWDLFPEPFDNDGQCKAIARNTVARNLSAAGQRPPLFANILPADYSKICASSRVKEFPRGQMLYIEGSPVQQVFLITSGIVKTTKFGQMGSEVIVRVGVPGDVLGALGLFTSGAHHASAQALRLCRTLSWEASAFKGLVEGFPCLHHNMVRITDQYLLELEDRFREVATERVGPRVARQLIRLLKQIGRPVGGGIEIGLSREEVAQMTGTTLFTVSRLISTWETAGMVLARREAVVICDIQTLRALSEGS